MRCLDDDANGHLSIDEISNFIQYGSAAFHDGVDDDDEMGSRGGGNSCLEEDAKSEDVLGAVTNSQQHWAQLLFKVCCDPRVQSVDGFYDVAGLDWLGLVAKSRKLNSDQLSRAFGSVKRAVDDDADANAEACSLQDQQPAAHTKSACLALLQGPTADAKKQPTQPLKHEGKAALLKQVQELNRAAVRLQKLVNGRDPRVVGPVKHAKAVAQNSSVAAHEVLTAYMSSSIGSASNTAASQLLAEHREMFGKKMNDKKMNSLVTKAPWHVDERCRYNQ